MAIEFDGEFSVRTPRAEAYAVLSETQNFAPLLPTYKSHELREDGSVDVRIKVGVGKIRGTATIILTLEESETPRHAKYVGKGSVMGSAFNLISEFNLDELGPEETRVRWRGELVMYGKLVSLAGGMIKPIANKDINRLITAIQRSLGGEELQEIAEPRAGWMSRCLAWIRGLFSRRARTSKN